MFWTGLFIGWLVGNFTAVIILMFFAGVKRNNAYHDWLYEDRAYDLEEKLKGRRE